MKKIIILCLLTCSFPTFGQEDEKPIQWDISGFVDLYYGQDFREPLAGDRFPFLYNHNRKNRPSINLALVTVQLKSKYFRANLGIQQGTYAQDNLSEEPKALRWIHQANVGVALDQNQSLWLDVGVLPSHIGFENAISTKNLTLSRSLIAENSPYFETGARLKWKMNQRWDFAFLVLNGWQRIRFIPGKAAPSFGTRATYTPNENTTLNWSTFLGTDQPAESGTYLYFSNLFGKFRLDQKWNLIIGLDVGNRTVEGDFNPTWWGTSLILQRQFSGKFASAIRYEYYHDPFLAIATSLNNWGIETGGISLNTDWTLGKVAILRLEGRYLTGPSLGQDNGNSTDFFLLGSIAFTLN